MGSVAFSKDSKMYQMFSDYFKLIQSIWQVEENDHYWEQVVIDTTAFHSKYKEEYALDLVKSLTSELSRKSMDMDKILGNVNQTDNKQKEETKETEETEELKKVSVEETRKQENQNGGRKMKIEANMTIMEKDNMMAFGEVTINNCLCIKNLKLMKNKDGQMFVSMPRVKKGEEWTDLCYAKTPEARDELLSAITEAVKKEVTKDMDLPGLEVNVNLFEKDNLRGLATIVIEDFAVKNVKIVNGPKGLFVSMPQYKIIGADGTAVYKDIVYPTSAAMREKISSKILEAYEEKVKEKALEEPQVGKEPELSEKVQTVEKAQEEKKTTEVPLEKEEKDPLLAVKEEPNQKPKQAKAR